MFSLARATTGPRLNGPPTACTTIDSPYGAPSNGPVRYTLPLNVNGAPEPAVTATVPIWLAEVQVPAFASASLHGVTVEMAPTSPGGRTTFTAARYWLPCGRTKFIVNVVFAPPCAGSSDVLWAGENGSVAAHPFTSKLATGDCAAVPVNGVNVVAAALASHFRLFASGASGPPLRWMTTLVKGCSGFSLKTVVSWPVVSLGTVSPLTRTITPYLSDEAAR